MRHFRESLPPSLILKIDLSDFLAIFARYPLVRSILVEVLYFPVTKKKQKKTPL